MKIVPGPIPLVYNFCRGVAALDGRPLHVDVVALPCNTASVKLLFGTSEASLVRGPSISNTLEIRCASQISNGQHHLERRERLERLSRLKQRGLLQSVLAG